MKAFAWLALAASLALAPAGAAAQSDGPGAPAADAFLSLEDAARVLPRLRTPVRVAAGSTVEQALRAIAEQVGCHVIYRGGLPGLGRALPAAIDGLPAADALTRILRAAELELRVSRSGQMVVVARKASGAGTLLGRILVADTREPLAQALVSLDGGRAVVSDSAGRFRVAGVESGPHVLGITALGYAPLRLSPVDVPAEGTTRVDTALVVEALPLETIVVTPGTFDMMQENGARSQMLSREQIAAMPQLLEDINHAVTRLPGVTAADATARFSLRGGSYDEVLVLLDGVELDEPFHLAEIGSVLSIVDVEAIGGVELTSGGFTAEHGDRLTGVFDMKTVARPTLGTHLSAGLSASNARLMGRGGFAGDRGQWLLSARRGYFDLLLKMVGEDRIGLVPRYGDMLGKVEYRLSDRQRLSGNVLASSDEILMRKYAGNDDPSDGDYRATASSAYAWTNWRAWWTPRLSTRTVLSLTRLTQHRGGIALSYGLQNGVRQRDDRVSWAGALRQDWVWGVGERHALKWGGNLKRQSAQYGRWMQYDSAFYLDPPPALARSLRRAGTLAGGYLAWRVQPRDALTAEAGVRYDHYGLTGEGHWSPRLNVALQPGEGSTIRLAWGVSYQGQAADRIAIEDGDTLLYPAARAEHRVLSLEQRLLPRVTGRIELYERRMGDLRPRYFNATNMLAPVLETEPDRVRLDATSARARGLELLLTGEPGQGRIRWSASYALASTFDRVGALVVPRLDDHRHSLQLEMGYRAPDAFTINAGWTYRTGSPAFVPTFRLDTIQPGAYTQRETFDFRELERLPAYHRLDLRVTRSLRLGAGRMNLFLDVFNAYSRHNPRGWDYAAVWDARGTYTLRRTYHQPNFGILPTFGVNWGF